DDSTPSKRRPQRGAPTLPADHIPLSIEPVLLSAMGGVRYEKGTQVGILIWNVHRNAEFWPEPDEFRPERFLSGKPQTPFTWLPFGAGPRGCVGQRFAEMEFKIVLARTLSRFQIVLSPEIQDRLELSNPTAMLSTPKISILIKSRDS
ncbi:unnamed protein product, partial [Mesorhabditis belari]